MSIREMLEWAAKAGGMDCRMRYCEHWNGMALYTPQDGYFGRAWNPLTDDGDALRLAVKLNIVIDRSEVKPACWAYYDFRDAWYESMVDHGDDAYAATRFAITAVAASIGRGMKK